MCVSANYRLRPAARHPDHLIDLKKVIAWVREHGHEYGADPALLFVSGSSAGGHMASLAALTPNDPAFQPGFEDADTSVTAAIGLNGWYGSYYGQGATSSPLAHVRPDAPPFFVAHGDHDTVVPVEDARDFADTSARRLHLRSSTPSFPAPSTPSTCSTPSASRRSSTPSRPLPPGSDRPRPAQITTYGWSISQ